ncbi:hypothetical protein O6H91_19G017200 [Diphasiastrum complanatum]|uniref:Uncharacterized protein n=1 Tax=Diphasiastrum complanatum TaxID=34168 RepID=A0ACC2AT64_DIPCM|nr:hypothetical protein O6H91_19G017200 [Diphasiastrum complanatum]
MPPLTLSDRFNMETGCNSSVQLKTMGEVIYAEDESQLRSAAACARLTWQNLWVTVTTVKGDSQTLLHDLTGYAEPGNVTAIMGPSGSGKTTLLDALAGRLAPNATMRGEIKLNGAKAKLTYGIAAYLTQEDTLIGTLTVRETILFSAQLRLPDKMPMHEKKAMVESTIIEMGLQDCADTPIGNWHLRGLSGGERRRVSIALEILLRPRLLFLDEPTSGLDSASAFFVTQALKNLALDGHTVIASIHQPSSDVFELFDNLFLLSGGKTIYFGNASAACDYFAAVGFPCSSRRNPADHFLRTVNADFDKVRTSLKRHRSLPKDMELADPLNKTSAAEAVEILVKAYKGSELRSNSQAKVHEISMLKSVRLHASGSLSSLWMQAFTLTRRSTLNMTRDVGYYWLRVIIYLSLSFSIGTIFLKLGTNYDSIMARGSCIAYLNGFLTFMAIGGFPSFIEDMKVFHRERLNGHYGVLAFVIANTLSSAPFLLIIALSSGTVVYYMVQFHPGFSHFAFFISGLYACLLVVESLMMLVSTVVPNFLMGIIMGASIQVKYLQTRSHFFLTTNSQCIFLIINYTLKVDSSLIRWRLMN